MLGGEWEFYWSRLYEPKDFRNAEALPAGGTFIPVPSPWNSAGYPRAGFATYRLTILVPERGKLMLYVPEILSSATVWVNGEKIFSAGQVGADKESAVSYAKNDIIALPIDNGVPRVFEIIVQASNYENIFSGLQNPFRIGSEHTLPREVFSRWLMLVGVASAFFIIGFYHLALFLFREKSQDKLIYLFFAAYCIMTGLRFFFDNDSIAQFFFRNSLNTHINLIYVILTAFHIAPAIVFALLAFEIKLGPRAKTAYAAMLTAPFILVLVLPAPLSRSMALLYVVALFVTSVLAARRLSLAQLRDRPYLGLYFISLIVFILWGSAANTVAKTYFFVAPLLSNTFTTLSQLIMLSQDYTRARRKVRELAAATDFYHRMAHDLLTPLTIVSTNVQIANKKPEEAPRLLQDAQQEIMTMAEMINNALDKAAEEDKEMYENDSLRRR